jgi:membrane-associated protease RseP (regulator of RpoE activity)
MSVIKLTAKLDRTDGGTSWGFRMAGGKDFGSPVILQKVVPGSLAAKCGLQEGDTIIRIGGLSVEHLRHKEAQQRIIDAGNSLELTLERPGASSGRVSQNANSSTSFYSSSSSSSQPGLYNSGPKPFSGYSNNSVSSVTSQTAHMSLGSPSFGSGGGGSVHLFPVPLHTQTTL